MTSLNAPNLSAFSDVPKEFNIIDIAGRIDILLSSW